EWLGVAAIEIDERRLDADAEPVREESFPPCAGGGRRSREIGRRRPPPAALRDRAEHREPCAPRRREIATADGNGIAGDARVRRVREAELERDDVAGAQHVGGREPDER